MLRLSLLLAGVLSLSTGVADDASFDFMLGHWTSETSWMQPDQSILVTKGRHHFYRAFGGRGLIDDNQQVTDGSYAYTGSAIRTFDPSEAHWECRWYDGNAKRWGATFYLRPEDGIMTGTIPGSDQHGDYVDTITFDPKTRDHVSWQMERQYRTLDRPMTIGTIEYRRVR